MSRIIRLSSLAPHAGLDYDWHPSLQSILDRLARPTWTHRGDSPHVLLLDVPRIEITQALRLHTDTDAPLHLTIRAETPDGANLVQRNPDADVLSINTADGNLRRLAIEHVALLDGRNGLVVDNVNYLRLGPLSCRGQSGTAVQIGSDQTHRKHPFVQLEGLTVYHLAEGAEALRVAGGYSVHCRGLVNGEKSGSIVVDGGRLWIDGDRLVRTRDWQGGEDRSLIEVLNGDVRVSGCELLHAGALDRISRVVRGSLRIDAESCLITDITQPTPKE